MKKVIIAIICLVVVAAGVVGYFLYQRQMVPPSPAERSITTDAAIVFKFKSFSKSWKNLTTKTYHDDLVGINFLADVMSDVAFLDSIINQNEDARRLFGGSEMWVSVYSLNGHQEYCFSAQLPAVNLKNQVDRLIGSLLADTASISDVDVKDIHLKKITSTNREAYYAVHKGVFIYSYSLELVKRSVAQLNLPDGISKDKLFIKTLKTAGDNVDGNLFINYRKLPHLLAVFLKDELKDSYSEAGDFANWSEVDMNIKDHGLVLNGFSFSDDTAGHYLNMFKGQKPQEAAFSKVLPDNTASFIFFGVENMITFYSGYQERLDRKGRIDDYREEIRKVNEEYGIDVELDLLSWIGHEFGIAVTETNTESFADNTYGVFKSGNVDGARRTLKGLVEKLKETSGNNEVKKEVYNNFEITYIALPKILPRLFGSPFEQLQESYYTVIEDYVIFGNNTVAIKDFIDHYLADKTLSKDLYYSSFSENLSDQYNIFLYSNFRKSENIYKSYANKSTSDLISEQTQIMDNFEAISIQVSTSHDAFYNNIFVKYNPSIEVEQATSWEASLDTTFTGKPTIFVNHYSGENEIFVQDENNTIYLLNATGQVLWKKELPEKIMGEVHQVDIYKNKKFQLFFNTKSYLYLVDRNGENVDNFPVKLPKEATCPVAVFDYNNKKDYRFVLSLEDGDVYNYGKDGKEVRGWNFKKSKSTFTHPFQHTLIAGKDYIVNYDVDGKLYGVDRRGKKRMKFNDNIGFSPSNPLNIWKTKSAETSKIIATDTTGKIYEITFSGKVETFKLQEFTAKHHFKVVDLQNDNKPEYIFFDLNQLSVFTSDRKLSYKIRLDDQISQAPLYFQFPDKSWKIGIVSDLTNELLLYNSDGSSYGEFPVNGNTPFDISVINPDKPLVMAAGTGDNRVIIYSLK